MLKSSLTSLHSALVEVNVSQLSDELLELDLVELDNEVKTSPTPVEHSYALICDRYIKKDDCNKSTSL